MKRYVSLTLALLAASALPLRAQSQKEMTQALQRDLSTLIDEMKELKKGKLAQDDRLTQIYERLASVTEAIRSINDKVVQLQINTGEKLNEVTRQVGAPTQALSAKVDGMNDQFLNLSNTVAELNSRIGKLDAKLEDVKKMIQTIPATGAPPPPQQQGGGQQAAAVTPVASNNNTAPAVSGEKLFDDANRDYLAGNADLALQGFNEYLKNFRDAQRAPDAQFFIAEIYSRKEDFDSAVKNYDLVVSMYPDSSRVPNAHYMKGVALVKTGRRAEAAKEFKIVSEKYPSNELAKKAKDYLKILGVPVSQAPAQKKTTKRR